MCIQHLKRNYPLSQKKSKNYSLVTNRARVSAARGKNSKKIFSFIFLFLGACAKCAPLARTHAHTHTHTRMCFGHSFMQALIFRKLDISSSISYQTIILEIFFQTQDTGHMTQDTGHRAHDTGHRIH